MPSNHLILSSPSPPALNLSHHQGLFQSVRSLHHVARALKLQLSRFSPCLVSLGPIEGAHVWQSRAENLFIDQGMGMGEIVP